MKLPSIDLATVWGMVPSSTTAVYCTCTHTVPTEVYMYTALPACTQARQPALSGIIRYPVLYRSIYNSRILPDVEDYPSMFLVGIPIHEF